MDVVVVVVVFSHKLLSKSRVRGHTKRCWSRRKTRKSKGNKNSFGKYYAFPPKNARYRRRSTSEKVQGAN